MKLLFLVNDPTDIPVKQTTGMLMAAAAQRHESYVCGVGDLFADGPAVGAYVRRIPELEHSRLGDALKGVQSRKHLLSLFDALMVRTNPARDHRREGLHVGALQLLRFAADQGLSVFNDPTGLRRASTKLYLSELSQEVVPPCLVSHDPAAVEEWIRARGQPAVLKPARGTRGQDVFVLQPPQYTNIKQIIDVVGRDGFMLAQTFVPGAERGDVRVILIDGEILTVDGQEAAIARIPHGSDFRSNIHTGGTPSRAVVIPEVRRAVALIRDKLIRDGLFMVGADFIGGAIIELNVFSSGGLFDAARFYDRDFAAAVIQALQARVDR